MTRRVPRSWWNAPVITASSAAASVISLALFPVLTRLYDPAAIGGYGLFIAAASVLGAVITFRFDLAALGQPHDVDGDQQALSLCRLSLSLAIAGAALIGVVTALLVTISRLPTEMLWLAPGALGIAVAGLQASMDARNRRYGWVATLGVIRVLVFVAAAAVLAGSSTSASSLCAAATVSTVPSSVRLFAGVPIFARSISWGLLSTHREFPLFQTPAAALNAAPMLVLTVWIDRLAGPAVLGLVVAAARIQMAPVTALSSSVSSVLTTDVVAQRENPKVVRRLYAVALRNTVSVTAASGAVAIGAASFLELLLGPEWTGLRPYLIALLPLALAFMIAGVPTAVLGVIGQQRRVFTSRLILLGALVGAFTIATVVQPPGVGMVAVGSAVYLVTCASFAAHTYRNLGTYLAGTPELLGKEYLR